MQAYILIQTQVGQAPNVAKEIREVEGVVEAEEVTGPYDVIARVQAATVEGLGRGVVSRVQQVKGIVRTLTCPVVDVE